MRAIFLIVGLLFAGPAIAQTRSVQDQIVSQLEQQGFNDIELSRTFLGRIRIEAYSDTLVRELVFNPTGEILRDYWQDRVDDKATAPRVMNPDRSRDSTDNRSNANAASRDRSISDSGGSDDRSDGTSGSVDRNDSDDASNSGSERNDNSDDDNSDDDKSDDDKSDDDNSDDDKSDDDKGDSSEENDD